VSATPGPIGAPDAPPDDDDRVRPPGQVARVVMQVLWPAFLMAIVAEGIFFSMIDPHELRIVAEQLQDSRGAAYTIGFFVFWALFACSSGITYLLSHGLAESSRGGR